MVLLNHTNLSMSKKQERFVQHSLEVTESIGCVAADKIVYF